MSDREAVPNDTFSHADAGREAVIAAFEAAWLGGQRPRIADFLPQDDESDPTLLAELAHIDLECRLKAGEPARVEDYLAVWPALASVHDVTLGLIEAEYRLRRRREREISLDEFSRRFPQYAGELAMRLGSDGIKDGLGLESPERPSDTPPNASIASTLPPSATNAAAAKATRGDATRYRPLRFHAKGGLGEVHLAEDGELRREVALKRIQERHADNAECRRRFLMEAEITARLQHPGIVPVYGLVEDADGQPSYAMRFIEGRSLKEAIDAFHSVEPAIVGRTVHGADANDAAAIAGTHSRIEPPTNGAPTLKSVDFTSLEFRKLLGRYVDTCNAVAYAHSKGVVHRDLKPANIMLGEYGETLVVDWGLAKVVKPAPGGGDVPAAPEAVPARTELQRGAAALSISAGASEGTHQDDLIGTPQFMSPEQARRRHDIVGPASDVYSLGATLYVLITGKHPFSGKTRDEVLDQVNRGELARPRKVDSKVPAALEAVCSMAMALVPQDRYTSPRTLADDIEHWLADEPVTAHREGPADRAWRWLRRHRAGAQAAALALITIASVSLAAVAFVDAARRTTAATLVSETKAKNKARHAIDGYIDAVQEDQFLKDVRFQPLRKKLLKDALGYYQEFISEHEHDLASRYDLSVALWQVGKIGKESGSFTESLAAYRGALELLGTLTQEQPNSITFQSALASGLNNLGNLLGETGDLQGALAAHQRALAIRQTLSDDEPSAPEQQSRLADSHYNVGRIQQDTGDFEAARASYQHALVARRTLADEHTDVVAYQRDLAASYESLGALEKSTGRNDLALTSYERALAIRRTLAAKSPSVNEFQHDLAASYNLLGALQRRMDNHDAALVNHELAVAILQGLADANPTVTIYQSDLLKIQSSLGNIHRDKGNREKALASYERALEIARKLASDNPSVTEFQNAVAYNYDEIGIFHRHNGDHEAALGAYQLALAIKRELATKNPDRPAYWGNLAVSFGNLGNLYFDVRKYDAALASFREALLVQQKLVEEHPANPTYLGDLALTYYHIANAQSNMGEYKAASESCRQSLTFHERLVREHDGIAEYRAHLGRTYNQLGALQAGMNESKGALDSFQRACDVAEKLGNDSPEVIEYRRDLATARSNLGGIQLQLRNPTVALQFLDLALASVDRVLAINPGDVMTKSLLQRTRVNRALALVQLQRHAEAAHDWQRAAEFDDGRLRIAFRLRRADALARAGDHAHASAEASELAAIDQLPVDTLYNLTCVLSLCTAVVKDDTALTDQYATRAIVLLKRAQDAGFFSNAANVAQLGSDADLDELRDREDFKEFVSSIRPVEPDPRTPR